MQNIQIEIDIYDITGSLLKRITQETYATGFRIGPIEWNGLDEGGNPIGKGIYLYQLILKNETGEQIQQSQKLVILK